MAWLVTGQLFDAHRFPGRHPSGRGRPGGVRPCAGAPSPTGRALVALLVMSLLLSFGRTTFGGLTVLLPGSNDIFMRRFMMGVQLAGPLPGGHRRRGAACACGRAGRGTVAARARRMGGRTPPTARASWRVARCRGRGRPRAGVDPDRRLRGRQRPVDRARSTPPTSTQGRDVDRLIAYVQHHGGGRVYAGMPSNWGSRFRGRRGPGVQVPREPRRRRGGVHAAHRVAHDRPRVLLRRARTPATTRCSASATCSCPPATRHRYRPGWS